MAFKFTPRGPTKTRTATVAQLKARADKPTAAKDVGDGVIKVYMQNAPHLYIQETPALRPFLATHKITAF